MCDMCGKVKMLDENTKRFPCDWIIQNEMHFCSKECFSKYEIPF